MTHAQTLRLDGSRVSTQTRPMMGELEPRTLLSAPAAPTSFSASVVNSGTQIQLKWTDKSSNESGFEIFRGTSKTNLTRLTTVGKNVTTYKHTPPEKNKTYYFKVRSYNSDGKSLSAPMVSAKVTASGSTSSGGGTSSGGSTTTKPPASTASNVKVVHISSSSGLNSASWPASGQSIKFVLDSNAGPYSLSQKFVRGNVTIESSNPSKPAVIKLPDVWDNNGVAKNPTLTAIGTIIIRNIRTTGGTDTILLGSQESGNIVAENIKMDGGAIWRGNGAKSAYFKDNEVHGKPRANVYSSYGGTVGVCVIDHSGTSVPIQQGGRMSNGQPIGEAAIRIMNVNDLTMKGVKTLPWFYKPGKAWKQDVQIRPKSKVIKMINCSSYQVDVGDMVWRTPALPIDRVEFTNCTFTKSPNVTSGVKTIVFSNVKVGSNTLNKTMTY